LVKLKESISKAEPELMVIDESALQPAYDWMSLIKAYLDNQPPSDDNQPSRANPECTI
jgi:hypothetical protein